MGALSPPGFPKRGSGQALRRSLARRDVSSSEGFSGHGSSQKGHSVDGSIAGFVHDFDFFSVGLNPKIKESIYAMGDSRVCVSCMAKLRSKSSLVAKTEKRQW